MATRPWEGTAAEWWVTHVEAQSLQYDGISLSFEDKAKILNKFGAVTLQDTDPQTVAAFDSTIDHETLLTTNAITHLSSSNDSDTGTYTVEGHTVSGGVLTFVTQSVTLTGQTIKALSTALCTCTRISAATTNTASNLGVIYAHEGSATAGVPGTKTHIHATVQIGRNQTEKCQTAISDTDYYAITGLKGAANKKTAVIVEFELQIASHASISSGAAVWRPQYTFTTTDSAVVPLTVPILVPRNHHVRMVATASAGTTSVAAAFAGYLAKVTGGV